MVTIDGSSGEGGGQVLRTSLALSLVTGVAFRIDNVRAGRARPGLMRQHVTAVRAAAEICGAEVSGGEAGSKSLTFAPGRVRAGAYHFAVGTAGSATLVLQTILPALLRADGTSTLTLEGGTHNPAAPPFDFLARTFLPQLAKMGARVAVKLERHGFYPAGGGRFTVAIEPTLTLSPLTLLTRGEVRSREVEAIVAGLSTAIAERELNAAARALGWERRAMRRTELSQAYGPGNVLLIALASDEVTEIITAFGERGVAAEAVAERAAKEAARYLAADVPVGEHLADQLLLPMALAGGGSIRTLEPTSHTTTQAALLARFLAVDVRITREASDAYRIDVHAT